MVLMDGMKIGEVARRAGVTVRTLRYYEELGLLAPARDSGGQRHYDGAALARLYRIRLLRQLGTPLGDVDPDSTDLLATLRRHLAEVDERMAEDARLRQRIRAAESALLAGTPVLDEELLDLLSGLGGGEPSLTRRLTLLVYRDLAGAHDFLTRVFGLGPGRLTRDDAGRVVHGELFAGDGVIWLHPESEQHRLASPATLGRSTACMAVTVDDVDRHHSRVAAAGAEIAYPPTDMPYGVREYGARDNEGGLWSFMQEVDDDG